jgi:hypothetical protein
MWHPRLTVIDQRLVEIPRVRGEHLRQMSYISKEGQKKSSGLVHPERELTKNRGQWFGTWDLVKRARQKIVTDEWPCQSSRQSGKTNLDGGRRNHGLG